MTDAASDDPLEAILIGGRERRRIVIVRYDLAWPQRFEAERARIQAALGDIAHTIDHVGSTSVPGLAAKPIIDVLVAVADPEDELRFVPALEVSGYVLRVREPGHRMFRTPALDVQVHLLAAGDPEIGRMLGFRDRLRAEPGLRAEYEGLKRRLAEREWRDMNDYADAKGSFIKAACTDE